MSCFNFGSGFKFGFLNGMFGMPFGFVPPFSSFYGGFSFNFSMPFSFFPPMPFMPSLFSPFSMPNFTFPMYMTNDIFSDCCCDRDSHSSRRRHSDSYSVDVFEKETAAPDTAPEIEHKAESGESGNKKLTFKERRAQKKQAKAEKAENNKKHNSVTPPAVEETKDLKEQVTPPANGETEVTKEQTTPPKNQETPSAPIPKEGNSEHKITIKTDVAKAKKNIRMVGQHKINQYENYVKKYSQEFNVDANLIRAVIMQESHYDKNAESKAGACGLMQLMPATAEYLKITDRFDPEQNIKGGTKYLAYLLKKFNNNTELALAGYNAGPGNVKNNQIPKNRETVNYVSSVMSYYKAFQEQVIA